MYKKHLFYRKTSSIFLVFMFFFTAVSAESIKDKKINIVFRMDDPSAVSSTETEVKILEAFYKSGASVTYGIVPFACEDASDPAPQDLYSFTADKGNIFNTWIKRGTLDIALHGFSHQTRNAVDKSEFRGADYHSQVEKIQKGKKLLETLMDAKVTTFIPPWNQYDQNTLKALESSGFTTLSAAQTVDKTFMSSLQFIPYTVEPIHIKNAIEEARASSDTQPLIVVLFHVYDFIEASKEFGYMTFDEFEEQLKWLKSQEDIRLMSISQATSMLENLHMNRLKSAYKYNNLAKYLPSSLLSYQHTYQQSAQWEKLLAKVIVFYSILLLLVSIVIYILACLLLSKFSLVMKVATFGSTLISVIIAVYAAQDLVSHFKEMIIVIVSIGISLGLWKCYSKK